MNLANAKMEKVTSGLTASTLVLSEKVHSLRSEMNETL